MMGAAAVRGSAAHPANPIKEPAITALHIDDLMISMFVLRCAARNANYHKRARGLLDENANVSSRPTAAFHGRQLSALDMAGFRSEVDRK